MIELSGKKYISSKRAAKEFGYTSDYIGQLARGGKIEFKSIGRDRFINLDSLLKYTEKKPSRDLLTQDTSTVSLSPLKQNVSIRRKSSAIKLNMGIVGLAVVALLVIFPMVSGVSARSGSAGASVLDSVSDLASKLDNVYLGFLHKVDTVIVRVWNAFRNKTLALLSPILGDRSKNTVVTTSSSSGTTRATSSLEIEVMRTLVADIVDQELAKTIDYTSEVKSLNSGIVVSSSTGTISGDAALKQAIRSKFSDQVEVTVDNSGTAGTIKPIFKNTDSGSYIYVLVPKIQ